MPFGSRNANKPTWFTIVMHEYAPLTFFMVWVTASKTILSTSASGFAWSSLLTSSAKTLSKTSESLDVFIMRPPSEFVSSSALVKLPLWMR